MGLVDSEEDAPSKATAKPPPAAEEILVDSEEDAPRAGGRSASSTHGRLKKNSPAKEKMKLKKKKRARVRAAEEMRDGGAGDGSGGGGTGISLAIGSEYMVYIPDDGGGFFKGVYSLKVPTGFRFFLEDADGENKWKVNISEREHMQGWVRKVTLEDELREAARASEGHEEDDDDRPLHPFRTCPQVRYRDVEDHPLCSSTQVPTTTTIHSNSAPLPVSHALQEARWARQLELGLP